MAQSKNYYVSIVAGRLDIGLTIEAPDEYIMLWVTLYQYSRSAATAQGVGRICTA